MGEEYLRERSVILNLQQSLFKKQIPTCNTSITPDGSTLIIRNLSVNDMALVKLFTNTLNQSESRMYLVRADVYLGRQIHPIRIPGFEEILKNKIKQSEITSILTGNKYYTPFTSFKINSTTTGNVGNLVDQLAFMNPESSNTRNRKKLFTLYFDPRTAVNE
jgi:hypothetical protein